MTKKYRAGVEGSKERAGSEEARGPQTTGSTDNGPQKQMCNRNSSLGSSPALTAEMLMGITMGNIPAVMAERPLFQTETTPANILLTLLFTD